MQSLFFSLFVWTSACFPFWHFPLKLFSFNFHSLFQFQCSCWSMAAVVSSYRMWLGVHAEQMTFKCFHNLFVNRVNCCLWHGARSVNFLIEIWFARNRNKSLFIIYWFVFIASAGGSSPLKREIIRNIWIGGQRQILPFLSSRNALQGMRGMDRQHLRVIKFKPPSWNQTLTEWFIKKLFLAWPKYFKIYFPENEMIYFALLYSE